MTIDNIIDFTAAARTPRRPARTGGSARILEFAEQRERQGRSVAVKPATCPLTPADVWDAIDTGRVQLHYQPQYELASGFVFGVEALVRLVDTDGQLVYPDRFIDMVEQSDLIVPLGRTVIEKACNDLVALRASGATLPRVAINLSARQLNCDDGLLRFIDRTLDACGLDYADLEFELTERQSLETQSDGAAILESLAARGSRVTVDDFGVGYSSVACLAELPVSAFKLDRSLISRLPHDNTIQRVVSCLLNLASALDLDVVAEGIETADQQAWLERAGCPSGQGFGFARPMPVDLLLDFLCADEAGAAERIMGT